MAINSVIRSKLFDLIIILTLFILSGSFGYMLIEGYNFLDALYMTVITLSTVGFGEVYPLTDAGRVYTIILILLGVGVLAYGASIFAEELISGNFLKLYRAKQLQKKIKKLNNHVIICGFGRNGRQAARKLQLHNRPFVVIERMPDRVGIHTGLNNIIYVEGDATEDAVLMQAQIQKADAVITALPSDADNLFVVLTAKQLNKNLRVISRASSASTMSKLKIAGADNVIMPDKIGGEHMASLIVTPDLIEFIDKITIDGSVRKNMTTVNSNDLPKEYIGQPIQALDLRNSTGCTIVGYKVNDMDYQITPEYKTILQPNMLFIILGRPEQIEKLHTKYGLDIA